MKNLKERQAVQEAFSQNLISAREEERTNSYKEHRKEGCNKEESS